MDVTMAIGHYTICTLFIICSVFCEKVTIYDDIIMTSQQRAEIFGIDDVTGSKTRVKRSVRSGDSYRWEIPIRYRLDDEFDLSERHLVTKALREWHRVTCVQFSELPPGRAYHKPYIAFKKGHDFACTSYVGNQQMLGGQVVLLGSRCFTQFGRLLHEVGHVLGLLHEHMRADRDEYVYIRAPEANVNFEKATTESQMDFGVAYDFNSVMHYPVLKTDIYELKPRDPRYVQNIGQRSDISFLDARKINLAYCQDRCSTSIYPPPACQHGGYRHPTRCYKCLCPDGLGGLTCKQPARHRRAQCGGTFELSDEVRSHVIYSPGYFLQSGYKEGTECNWVITTSNNSRVAVEFRGHFHVPSKSSRPCESWVEINAKDDLSLPGYRFCGDMTPDQLFISSTSEISLVLKSSRPQSRDEARGHKDSQSGDKRNGFLAFIWLGEQGIFPGKSL